MATLTLSVSAKARVLRQQRVLIDKLTARLGACSMDDVKAVQAELFQAKADYATLSNAPTKARKARKC